MGNGTTIESNPPEHPDTPFVRILGEVPKRALRVGDEVHWRLSTQTVTPDGTSEAMFREVEIRDEAGKVLFTAPRLEIPPRKPDRERFDDQRHPMDCEHERVIDADGPPRLRGQASGLAARPGATARAKSVCLQRNGLINRGMDNSFGAAGACVNRLTGDRAAPRSAAKKSK